MPWSVPWWPVTPWHRYSVPEHRLDPLGVLDAVLRSPRLPTPMAAAPWSTWQPWCSSWIHTRPWLTSEMVREPECTSFNPQSLKVATFLLLLLYFLPNAWVLEIIWLYSVRILIGYSEFEWIELILAIICFTLSICKSYFRARSSNFSQFFKLSQKLYRKLLIGRWSKKVLAWRLEVLAQLFMYIC